MPLFMIIAFLAFWAPDGRAHTPPIPDPPNAITWQPVALKRVSPPTVTVPETCPSEYRSVVESGFGQVWQSCETIGKKEPSDCQRASFDRCVAIANRIRNLQPATCASYEKAARSLEKNSDSEGNQRSSQDSNSRLNESAAQAFDQLADQLGGDVRSIARSQQEAGELVQQPLCQLSSAREEYQPIYQKIASILSDTRTKLEALAQSKRKDARGHRGTAKESAENVAGLTTANTSNANGPSGSTKTSVSSPGLPPVTSGSSNNSNAWLPAAAVAAPIILGGLMVAKSGAPEGVFTGPGGGTGNGPILPPGGGFVEANGLFVDPSFTDRQRSMIAEALSKVPECRRPHLRGIAIRSANLGGRRGGNQCVAGLWSARGNRQIISLDPNCSFSIGVVLHEYMHSLGHRNGESLHRQYREVTNRERNCPVTAYGATSAVEDFAEAGRLALYPESGGRIVSQCTANRVSGLGDILRSCR